MSNVTTDLGGSPILNPFEPLVFLLPEQALQATIVRYICAGTAGAFIWDTLNNIIENYQLIFQHRIRLPTIVCFISTLFSLAYVIGSTIFQTAPIPDSECTTFKRSLEVLYCVATPSTSLLFFFRTRAVFDGDPWIVIFFAGMWLAVCAACVTPIIGVNVSNIGPTSYCMNIEIKPYAIVAAIIPLINDTLIFFAITWRLWCNSYARRTIKDGVRVLIFGDYLPAFSKAMLQDGQAYYLSTVTINLVNVTFLYVSSIPPILRTLPTVPNMALMNIMACRVFRNTMLGLPRENEISTSLISREIRAIHSVISAPSLREEGSGTGDDIKQGQLDATQNVASITVEHTHDCMLADDKSHIHMSAMV